MLLLLSMRERKRTTAKSKRLEKPPVGGVPVVVTPPVIAPPPVIAAATPSMGVPVTIGSVDSADWLRLLDVRATDLHWFVEVVLGVDEQSLTSSLGEATRLQIYVYPQEWGFLFCHQNKCSWIRIADRPYVHGRDEYGLVTSTPPLRELSAFARELEHRHGVVFRRDRVLVRTNLPAVDEQVRAWAAAL